MGTNVGGEVTRLHEVAESVNVDLEQVWKCQNLVCFQDSIDFTIMHLAKR